MSDPLRLTVDDIERLVTPAVLARCDASFVDLAIEIATARFVSKYGEPRGQRDIHVMALDCWDVLRWHAR